MKQHLNTLFVTTQGAYLAKEGRAVLVRSGGETLMRVPMHGLGGIVCFGRVSCSPFLLGACGESGIAVSLMTERGRFLARVHGYGGGNVLLRREQYRRADSRPASAALARTMVAGKIANGRTALLRALRDHPANGDPSALRDALARMDRCLAQALACADLDALRGIEGDAARTYFGAFGWLVTAQKAEFAMGVRTRRPPLDRINALLSFVYSLVMHDVRAACEAAGLDPAVGFLHRDRPGRPGLALDLMEEFRVFLGDRLAVSLINRRQVQAGGFTTAPSGAVSMDDDTRKTVLVAYQKRKLEEIKHPFLGEPTTVGLLPHLQARLLARHLRGELDGYPPFLWK